ncbi:class A beta-lactamase [Candidatus Accumulibacter phosphatis]|uniref:Beta-lactamase n=1 Tax=Candidatus Accumulibacter phosphatis TaxID=327160 RepID=A0ABX1U2J6_9PROT|nr:class A beta-lactamase [Candidatus Accumulibacter phosphatis]
MSLHRFFSTFVCALETTKLINVVQAEENALQARVGMTVFDANTGTTWQYRGDERFPLNSTHKIFSCAALLAKVDGKSLSLDQSVSISKEMLVTYSPITEKSLSPQTMTFGEVCRAAVSYSDNTAANVVFDAIGGTTGFNSYMQSIGDDQTRLDRKEPELNDATPGDERDTTTPNDIVSSLRKILLGNGLSVSSRNVLTQWMLDDQVAGALLRASLPSNWKIADKTGAGGYGSRSIVAVIWPPSKQPVVVGIYVTQTKASLQASNEAIARIGAALKEAIGR